MEFLMKLPGYVYCFELLLAILLFWFPLEKRKKYGIPLVAGCIVLFFAGQYVSPWLRAHDIHIWFYLVAVVMFLLIYAMSKISVKEVLYCISCGYFTQHLASSVLLFALRNENQQYEMSFFVILYIVIYAVVYGSAYFLVSRSLSDGGHYQISWQNAIILTIVMVIVVYFLSILTKRLSEFFNVDTQNASYQLMLWICQIYAAFVCVLMLLTQRLNRREVRAVKDLEKNKKIWDQKKAQFEISKENMELINRKFHDMKHQMAALLDSDVKSDRKEQLAEELNRIMQVNESRIDTGNEALDTILMEKGLFCSMHNISWSCMADGSFLNFMDVVDLYTLLGNALDNAIEYVTGLDNNNRKYISVRVGKEMGFASFQIRNYFEGNLKLENGLPVTTKKDKSNHGYGMKSISYIVEKYKGTMTLKAEENVFQLSIIIPLK